MLGLSIKSTNIITFAMLRILVKPFFTMLNCKQFLVGAVFCFSFSAVFAQEARVYYVAADGSSSADATNWANATTLQSALDNYTLGDTLFVKAGSYTPTMTDGRTPSDPCDASFQLPDNIVIYGGFAGTETSPEDRNMALIATTNETLIEGNRGDRGVNTDNIKLLFRLADADTATLDGLSIAGGNNRGQRGSRASGIQAGRRSQLTLRRCRLVGNEAHSGGAIYVGEDGTTRVTASTFTRNITSSGASGTASAIFIDDRGRLTLTHSTFEENARLGLTTSGGAVSLDENATGRILGCSFLRNRGGLGAALHTHSRSGNIHVSNSLFVGNSSTALSVLYAEGMGGSFINNTVYNSRANTNIFGIIGIIAGEWVVANNILYGNTTRDAEHELAFFSSVSVMMAHNLIEGDDILNAPTRTNAITPPTSVSRLFASLNATNPEYLRLIAGSVGVDAGNNDYIDGNRDPFNVADTMGLRGLGGNDRIINTTVDVGAYELPFAAASLHIAGADGERIRPLEGGSLPKEGGNVRLRVAYTGGMSVSIAKTRDPSNILTLGTTSVVSSFAEVMFSVQPNTTTATREVVLTFTLQGATPAFSQPITFVQERRATIIHVARDGDADANGLDWAHATTFQTALDNYVTGDTLFMKKGSYVPTRTEAGRLATDSRNATYVLPDEITIYAGFAGTETSLARRDLSLIATTNKTLIDGNIGEMMSRTDNIRRLFRLAEDDTVILDGLTLEGAYAEEIGTRGSALFVGPRSQLTLRYCSLANNVSRRGGAIFVDEGGALIVENSTFEANEARSMGGAIFAENGTLNLKASTFENNRGGHSLSRGSSGAAIFLEGNGSLIATSTTFEGNTLSGMSVATAEFHGTAVSLETATGTFDNCSFLRNRGDLVEGTLYSSNSSALDVSNSLFAGNTTSRGAAIYSFNSAGSFINNTVYGNKNIVAGAAAVSLAGNEVSNWVVANNILYGNTKGIGQFELYTRDRNHKTLAHNLIQGNTTRNTPERTGAITPPFAASVLFASTDATDDNYLRLVLGSVGVDAGNNDYIDGDADSFETEDTLGVTGVGGNDRIINTTVDVGAYEAPVSSRHAFIDVIKEGSQRVSLDTVFVAASGGAGTLVIRFAGSTAINLRESSDPSNIITLSSMRDASSGRLETPFTMTANTTNMTREAVLTFELQGVTPALSQDIRFIQRRGVRGVIHVAEDGEVDANGLSWAHATTFQTALDNYVEGDTLFMKKGSYVPTKVDGSVAEDPRNGVFTLPDGIVIYGGFVGNEAGLENRDIQLLTTTNATVMEGNIGDRTSPMDNIRYLFEIEANDTVVLDGLTVARGYNDGRSTDNNGSRVGAESQLTLRHSRFMNNQVSSNGGAIYVEGGGMLIITASSFEENTADNHGGAIYAERRETLTIVGSTFTRNVAENAGGAIYIYFDGTLNVRQSVFEHNRGAQGNPIRQGGAAIFMHSRGSLNVTGTTFEGNILSQGISGVAAFVNASTSTFDNCSFLRNSGPNTKGTLAAIDGGTLHVSNSLFVGNILSNSPALYSLGADGSFVNNTVYGNTATTSFGATTINLTRGNTSWVIANNILYGNTTMDSQHELTLSHSPNKVMAHNLIQNNDIRNGPTRIGAITPPSSVASLFASLDPADPNYLRLLPGSVAIDGGNNDYINGNADPFEVADTLGMTDLGGNKRIFNATVDLGAYEAPASAPFLRIVGIKGEALQPSTGGTLPALGGELRLHVVYAGMDATGVRIAKTRDTDNILSLGSTSVVSSSPAEVMLRVSPNTTITTREVTLTFTLEGTSPVLTQTISFVQERRAVVLHVATNGDVNANGLSWTHATTLSSALLRTAVGDTLFVKAGRYTPTDSAGMTPTDPRNATYTLPVEVSVYGGFAGTESSLSERDLSLAFTTQATILEGNRGDESSSLDNIRQLLSLESGSVTLAYLTMARARNEGGAGGALASSGRDLIIRYCRFIRNEAAMGSALYSGTSSIQVQNSLFADNRDAVGAAVHVSGDRSKNFYNNTFYNNRGSLAGALRIEKGTIRIINNIIWGNTPATDQIGLLTSRSAYTISHNLVEGGARGISGTFAGDPATNLVSASSLTEVFASIDASSSAYLLPNEGGAAVDAGNNDYINGDPDAYVPGEEAVWTDIRGMMRLVGTRVDLGPYEFQGSHGIEVVTTPTFLRSLPSAGGRVTATITLSGSANRWVASAGEGAAGVVMLPAVVMGASGESLAFSYGENTTTENREINVILETQGIVGMPERHTLTLIQVGQGSHSLTVANRASGYIFFASGGGKCRGDDHAWGCCYGLGDRGVK